jgi:hypothetical protein
MSGKSILRRLGESLYDSELVNLFEVICDDVDAFAKFSAYFVCGSLGCPRNLSRLPASSCVWYT